MGSLKNCLDKAGKSFTSEEVEMMLKSSEKYKAEGTGELEADTMAVVDFHEKLQNDLNKLRDRAKLPKEKVEKVKVEKEPTPEPKKEPPVKVNPKEVFARKEVAPVKGETFTSGPQMAGLLESGYDNATIEKAVKEMNRVLSLPSYEAFFALKEKGIFNLGKGEKYDFRPDVGLSSEEFNNTVRQLEEGKKTKTADKLLDFVDKIKETGEIPTIGMTGGSSLKYRFPLLLNLLGEKSNAEMGLSKQEEEENLAKLEAQKMAEAQMQKKTTTADIKDVQRVVDAMKKALPKFSITYDPNLSVAGNIQGNKIKINPNYSGISTPIHEAGHALIDFIGYNNKVIQSGIAQLKNTPLWAEIKQLYKELNDEMLGKEVLAEAIGREGEKIFDKEVDRNKFMQALDYIYTKLKQLLGIDKNVAKSLAKQIIGGIKTQQITTASEELQLRKKRELTEDEQEITDLLEEFKINPDLSAYTYESLLDVYHKILTSKEVSSTLAKKAQKQVLARLGMNFYQRYVEKAKSDPNFSEEMAMKKDIGYFDKQFKVLSHFSEAFPEMKGLSEKFQEAYFNKVKSAREKKNLNEKLAKEVIKDRNKKLGIAQYVSERFGQLLGNQNYKFFDFLDNGKGQLPTISEAEKKGLSKAQIDYLKFVREEIGERQKIFGSDTYDIGMEVLKNDKKFYENFKTENGVAAMSSLLGNSNNINNVRIEYTDPNTGKKQISEYENIEKLLSKYGEKGIKEKVKAIMLIAKYNFKARKQLKLNVNADEKGQENVLNQTRKGEYSLDDNGQLRSKFDRPRNVNRAYSKDFYTAMQEYIDDTQHAKYMSPLVPIINAIDQINRLGAYEYEDTGEVDDNGNPIVNRITRHGEKPNVTEWIKEWSKLHITKESNATDPRADIALRFLRHWASLSTMMFNVPAQGMNLAIGIYNNWRKENSQTVAKGLARLFAKGDRKVKSDFAYGLVNPIAVDLARKYGAVSTDVDSNPISTAGGIMAKLGFLGTKWGEFIIQTSGLLGKLSDEDFNSFEYKQNKFGVDELVIKDSVKDKAALEKRILDAIDEVSDIQGKYSEKDRRNIMNNEWGKAVMQYKVWMPDWYRVRFGEGGSWSSMFNGGIKEIRDQVKDKGFMKTLASGEDTKAVKDFKSNLKGLLVTALLMSFVYGDDDDEPGTIQHQVIQKKLEKQLSDMAKRALSDVLFIFDPNTLKFTISRPIAATSKITDLLDAVANLGKLDSERTGKDVLKLVPAKKVVDVVDMLDNEE